MLFIKKPAVLVAIAFIALAIYLVYFGNYPPNLRLPRVGLVLLVAFANLFVLSLFWLIIHLLAGKSLEKGMSDFIIGDHKGYSLSRLQAVLWAITIMASQFAILFIIWMDRGFDSIYQYQPVFSDSAVWLLGLSLASCLSVKGITVERIRTSSFVKIKDRPRLSDIIKGPNGLDFSRCQMLIWTFLGIFVFNFNTYNFISAISDCNVDIAVLFANQYEEKLVTQQDKCKPYVPYLSWSFVVLMGLSQGAYIGKKLLPAGYSTEGSQAGITEDQQLNVPVGIIVNALNENRDLWKEKYQVEAIAIGTKKPEGKTTEVNCLVFQPREKISPTALGIENYIPPVIIYHSPVDGLEYHIPTDVRAVASTIIASADHPRECHGYYPKRPGCSIGRINSADSGTIGLKVYRGNTAFLLSCYHVLCSPELGAGSFILKDYSSNLQRRLTCPSMKDGGATTDIIGQSVEGYLDGFMDGAIGTLPEPFILEQQAWGHPNATMEKRTLSQEDIQQRLVLSMYGRTSGYREGILKFIYSDCYVIYSIQGRSRLISLKGLIQTTRLSESGDSGAPVFDPLGNIVGLVVATADADSFIVPIQRLLSYFNVSLKPSI